MSLPKKGTRKLLVSGRNYLWTIRRTGDQWDGYDLRLTVLAEDTGEIFSSATSTSVLDL
jgi:hypothetical protein